MNFIEKLKKICLFNDSLKRDHPLYFYFTSHEFKEVKDIIDSNEDRMVTNKTEISLTGFDNTIKFYFMGFDIYCIGLLF